MSRAAIMFTPAAIISSTPESAWIMNKMLGRAIQGDAAAHLNYFNGK
jgi:hypothetical protein